MISVWLKRAAVFQLYPRHRRRNLAVVSDTRAIGPNTTVQLVVDAVLHGSATGGNHYGCRTGLQRAFRLASQ
jgi:hypothetical protein